MVLSCFHAANIYKVYISGNFEKMKINYSSFSKLVKLKHSVTMKSSPPYSANAMKSDRLSQ